MATTLHTSTKLLTDPTAENPLSFRPLQEAIFGFKVRIEVKKVSVLLKGC